MVAVLLVGGWNESAVATLSRRGHDLRWVPLDGVATEHAAGVDCAAVAAGTGDLAVIETFSEEYPALPIVYAVGSTEAGAGAEAEGGAADGAGSAAGAGAESATAARSSRGSSSHGDVTAALEFGADDHVHLAGPEPGDRLAARVERLAGSAGPTEPSRLLTDGDRSGTVASRSGDDPFEPADQFGSDDGPSAGSGSGFDGAVDAADGGTAHSDRDVGFGSRDVARRNTSSTDESIGPVDERGGAVDGDDEAASDDTAATDGADATDGAGGVDRADVVDGTDAAASGRSADRNRDRGEDRRIRALLERSGALVEAEDEAAIAETIVTAAEEALGYDLVAVHLLGTDGEELTPAAVGGLDGVDASDLEPWTVDEHPAGRALSERDLASLHGDAVDDAIAADADGLRELLVLPLGDHGTLCIATTEADGFGDENRRVAELLAANATVALDRSSRLDGLERLHRATQTLLDAKEPAAVAERALEAAEEILGHQCVGFYLHDAEAEHLEATAWTEALQGALGIPEDLDAGGPGPWEAFEENRVIRYDRAETDDLPYSERFASQLHVPVGQHGLLLVGAPEPEAFDGTDVQLARLLATTTARTLDRVERTQELERYQSVFETVSDMVFVADEKGFITHCTPALARRLGYRRSKVLGMHVSQLVGEEALQEIAEIADRLVDKPRSAARTQRVDLETRRGEEIPVQVDVSLLPGEGYGGVVGTIREISDLLAVQEELDSQQDRFEYLFENIPDPVVETSHEDGRATAVSVNPAFVETFGFDAEQLRDRPLNDVIVPDEHQHEADILDDELAEGEIHQAEIERETQYGVREFLFRGVPYTARDDSTRAFAIYTDITEQRERERHLDVLQRILRHNVRNDVNVLLGGLDKFERDGLDQDTLDTLQRSADDLLEMSKKAKRISHVLEADREQLGTVDLTTLTRDVIEQYRGGDADVQTDLPPECPVVGSRTIARAIEELVENAVRHAGDEPTVEVSITVHGQRASVTVADDGDGVPEQEKTVLQEDEITPVQHASGLGLWLVKHATTASGGTISFDEPSGGGSVTLSFRRADEADASVTTN